METYRDLLSQIHTNCKNIPFHKKLSAYNIFDVLEIQSREVIMCRFFDQSAEPGGNAWLRNPVSEIVYPRCVENGSGKRYIAIAYGGSQRVPD